MPAPGATAATVTVNVTAPFAATDCVDSFNAAVVLAGFTSSTVLLALPLKRPSPGTNVAVTWRAPTVSPVAVNAAWPLPLSGTAACGAPSTAKVTDPAAATPIALVTVATNVAAWPQTAAPPGPVIVTVVP